MGSTVEHTVEGASEIDGRFDHHSLSAPGRQTLRHVGSGEEAFEIDVDFRAVDV
ncbi:MAG: hypothetical protein V3S32_06045 [Acidimicrobiia bacterium]